MNTLKRLSITSVLAISLFAAPVASAEIQCPMGWVKKVENSVVVCVAQDQNQAQAQIQNNNQNQNVNQNVNATGGSSSSSSSSSSNTNVTINNPTPAPTTTPQVVYQAQTKLVELPKTGLPETAMALSTILPAAGFALKKFGFKKNLDSVQESANSIWTERELKG